MIRFRRGAWGQDDNSMKFKSNKVSCEPRVNIEPESQTVIQILLNLAVDYCSYECSVNELSFPDTFALQVFI